MRQTLMILFECSHNLRVEFKMINNTNYIIANVLLQLGGENVHNGKRTITGILTQRSCGNTASKLKHI